ncbi:hypothetical protein TNCV_4005831 [Trichonephila clavipes]|nr:hypothetical protein TNCV_4005831 [Trichonephila clavipes]
MFQSGGQCSVKPPVWSSRASLVLIYRPTEELKVNGAKPIEGQGPLRPLDTEVHEQTSRSGDQSEDPQFLSPQASLVLMYRPTAVGIRG